MTHEEDQGAADQLPEAVKYQQDNRFGYIFIMRDYLPTGVLGMLLASFFAAYMSTISTHLNWGASYIVNDFYKQQINPTASEKQLVNVGRFSTVVLFLASAALALLLTNALQLFDFILMFGAGTGLIFILRWFWWRINAWSEISAIFVSGIVSVLFNMEVVSSVLFGVTEGVVFLNAMLGWFFSIVSLNALKIAEAKISCP